MKISEVKVWFGTVIIDYNNGEYELSCNNAKSSVKVPRDILSSRYETLGDVMKTLFTYDNEYRAQLECSP